VDLKARQELNNGFGNGLQHALEFALTPLIFAGIGYLGDQFLGTTPVATLTLFVFAVGGMGAKSWYEYDQKMVIQEQELRDRIKSGRTVGDEAGS
jgi:F0F1-type ATP synthase assembly protein I